MRWLVLIGLVCMAAAVFAQSNPLLQKTITVTENRGTLAFFLDMLEKQGVGLAYNNQQLRMDKPIRLSEKNYTVEKLIQIILDGENVETAVANNKLVIYRDAKKPLSISGTVYAANSKETLPYATIKVLGTGQVAIGNAFGFYSLMLPAGNYVLQASYVGYATQTDTLALTYSKTLNFKLAEANNLESVEIHQKTDDVLAGRTVALNKAYQLPLLLGEADPLKLLSFKAGVIGSNLSVRGGTGDQNLVLLDGAPIVYPNHFLGLLSIFNNDVLKRVDLYKGSFPARYEGRLSSVIDVKLKDGDMEQYHGNFNIGLATAGALLEGPIIKNKSSFIASFRRSWIDGLSRIFVNEGDLSYRLYDANIKLNYVVDSTSRIFLSAYTGGDVFKVGIVDSDLSWYNRVLALRWNKVAGPGLFINNSVTVSSFSNNLSDLSGEGKDEESHVGDVSLESNLNYTWSSQTNTSVGLRLSRDRFSGKTYLYTPLVSKQSSVHLNAYVENLVQLAPKWQLNAGLNYAVFAVPSKTYQSLQPRSWLKFDINDKNSVSLSYALMTQFYHQLTNSILAASPSDFRAPSSAALQPEQAAVFELGYHRKLAEGYMSFQLYHKLFSNLLMFDPNSKDKMYMADLLVGKGQSRGLELEFEKKIGRFSGQGAFTWAKTWLEFPSLNNGKRFSAPNDIAINLQTALSYRLAPKWEVSSTFYYVTGRPISVLQTQDYSATDIPYGYRLGDNYTLSLGFTHQKKYKSGNSGRLYFGVNNLVGRPVPLFVDASMSNGQLSIDQSGMFRRFPYVGYAFGF